MPTLNGQGGVAADTRRYGPRRFVYQPGGTAAGNVYTDFHNLYDDLSAATGQKELVFDASFVGGTITLPVPAGPEYDFTNTKWSSGGNLTVSTPGTTTVAVSPLTVIRNLRQITGLIVTHNAGAGVPPITYNSGGNEFLFLDRATLNVNGASLVGLVSVVDGGTPTSLFIVATDNCILGGTGQEWVYLQGSSGITMVLRNSSDLRDDSVYGLAGTSLTVDSDVTSVAQQSQPGMGGTVNFALDSDALRLGLDPTGLTNVTATNVRGAIGELDAAIGGGGGAVTSVFSRTGAVVAATSDYDAVQVDYNPLGLNIVTSSNVQGAVADLDSAVNSSGVQTNTVYVSKTGNNSNSGLSPRLAKLTVASAITAASGLTPSSVNRVVIQILDAGIYSEGNLVLPNYVSLIGNAATLFGTIQRNIALGEESVLQLARMHLFGVNGNNVTTKAWATVESIFCNGFPGLAHGGTGTLYADIEYVEVTTVNGVSVGGSGVVRGRVGTINVTGAGIGISHNSTSDVCLIVGCILAPSGTAVNVANQPINLDVVVDTIQASVAYQVLGLATLNIVVARRVGTSGGGGTINEIGNIPVSDISHQTEVAVVPAGTINSYFFAPDDITIVAIKAYTETVPVSAGVYTIAVEDVDNSNNLLNAATENLKTLGAATLTSFSLTATTADLNLLEGTRVRIRVVSDNADLVASGVYAQIIYRSQ